MPPRGILLVTAVLCCADAYILVGARQQHTLVRASGGACIARTSGDACIARASGGAAMMAKKKGGKGGGGAAKMVQVVLSEPIKGVGKKGELVSVKPAYAENFVVSGGRGVLATPEMLDQLAAEAASAAADAVAAKAAAVKNSEALESIFGEEGCLVKKNVGPDGTLFGSVTAQEVADLLKELAGISVEKKNIEPPDIKAVGSGTCVVKLHKEVHHKLKVVVAAAQA